MPPQRIYNALNGDEIKRYLREDLIAELDRHLNADTDLKQHRTFHLVSWEWNLKVSCTPQDRGMENRRVSGSLQACNEETRELLPPSNEEPLVFEVSNTRSPVSHPDKFRQEAGMPIPMRSTVPGVGTIDAPTNRDRTEKTRSVSLHKEDPGMPASAPSGVAARENAGHHIPSELQEQVVTDK